MSESRSLASATDRLEQFDTTLATLDLRGKWGPTLESSDTNIPRSEIVRFIAALRKHCNPPPSLKGTHSWKLKHIHLHNNFLDPCELPLLFDALPCIPSLETFLLVNHDVGDGGVDLLMHALSGDSQSYGRYKAHESYSVIPNENESAESCGLKELYLSHCNITCKGAASIASALDRSSQSNTSNRLKYLQVLSLGSNHIEEKGAKSLADAFGRYPSLHRLVLHGNGGIASSKSTTSSVSNSEMPIYHHALLPNGWKRPVESGPVKSTPTKAAMSVFAPLIQSYIQRRWEKDRILIRPHDLLRQQLRHEIYKKHSTFVDSNLEVMPDILSWMGRDGACCRQTSLHSHSFSVRRKLICHSTGCEQCKACATIHLNDVHELFMHMPHLVYLFRNMSTSCTKHKKCEGLFC